MEEEEEEKRREVSGRRRLEGEGGKSVTSYVGPRAVFVMVGYSRLPRGVITVVTTISTTILSTSYSNVL